MHARMMVLCLLVVACLAPAAPAAEHDADRQAQRERRRSPVVEVFQRTRDAVVNIAATEIVTVRSRSPLDGFFEDFFDMPRRSPRTRQYKMNNLGSGFIIHPDGYIVTNAHVVARSAELKAIFADGREYPAQIIASDRQRDLAVLKIEAESSLPTLPLGRSDDLMIGETVIAIGNPLGYEHTVTAGVVSAVKRDIAVTDELAFTGLIQTDASINPGNSGGPLLNVLGELIGVNSAIRGDAQNIGFAIPVDQLREVLPELLDVERRQRIDSGLRVGALGEPRVIEVRADSPADEAGIQPGDVLLAVDGRPVRKGVDFDIALLNHDAGDELDLTLRRGERQVDAELRLAARPAPDGRELARGKLGIEVHALPADVAEQLGLSRSAGLLVTEIEPGGPADEAGLQRRDILLALGRHAVASVDDLGHLLEQVESGDVVAVHVLRVDRWGKAKMHGPLRVR
ncbi:MAG: trypsin-like peptidase domain-containing protein [Planctomycetota bacterium]|nr:trypsin-like peptidase domain-containing protein [Planctomycetota bacterium]